MILEHALLEVKAGQGAAFETAIRIARPLIEASPGFLGIQVRRAAEAADKYLLTVEWSDIAAHRDGFRNSERYEGWRALLHGYYDRMPTITYFSETIL